MANVDNPRGFHPVDPVLRVTRYLIESEYATALYTGDPVVLASGVLNKATAGATNAILGSIVGFECVEDGIKGGGYYPASSTKTWYALVADHPDQRFVAQDDGTGTDIALDDIGKFGNAIYTHSGNTSTNLSGAELDGSDFSGTAATSTSQFQLIDLSRTPDNAVGDNADWVVQIQNHQLRQASS